MRLSFYLRKEKLLEIFTDSGVHFGPFSPNDDGAYDLSYRSRAWYLGHLGDDRERQVESEWCQYAMGVADGEYLKEVVKLGYGNGQPVDAKVFREEIMLYVTKLRNGMKRNDIAHVFSRSVKQVWMKTDRFVKTENRCLLDQPALALDDGYKKKLVAVLDNLTIDMPKGLHALGNNDTNASLLSEDGSPKISSRRSYAQTGEVTPYTSTSSLPPPVKRIRLPGIVTDLSSEFVFRICYESFEFSLLMLVVIGLAYRIFLWWMYLWFDTLYRIYLRADYTPAYANMDCVPGGRLALAPITVLDDVQLLFECLSCKLDLAAHLAYGSSWHITAYLRRLHRLFDNSY
ncbi:unnamed protein product [Calypogeia fissa]